MLSGLPVRRAARNPQKTDAAAEAVRFDGTYPDAFAPALARLRNLLSMAPPLDPNAPAELGPVIAEARAVGVRHVSFVPAFGADRDERAPSRMVEHLVVRSSVPSMILRANLFVENRSEGL